MDDDDGLPEWVEPEWDDAEHQRFRAALTTIDVGEADMIFTPSVKAAELAKAHGYQVEVEFSHGATFYKIMPGDSGIRPVDSGPPPLGWPPRRQAARLSPWREPPPAPGGGAGAVTATCSRTP